MESCNDTSGSCDVAGVFSYQSDLLTAETAEYIERLKLVALDVIKEIQNTGFSPYLLAFSRGLKHVVDGGTINTFKPLVRTSTYAGIDRRKTENSVH